MDPTRQGTTTQDEIYNERVLQGLRLLCNLSRTPNGQLALQETPSCPDLLLLHILHALSEEGVSLAAGCLLNVQPRGLQSLLEHHRPALER
jgi:hypothetical protein